jgi:proteasome lid subunit RPN8/RPN11
MMMKCVKPLVIDDPWHGEISFRPGIDQVAADTSYVRDHPECWEACTDARSAARSDLIRVTVSRTAPRKRKFSVDPERGREPWRLPPISDAAWMRTGDSSRSPVIRLTAYEQLLSIVRATTGVDVLEAGGLGVGSGFVDDDARALCEVVEVSGPGPKAARRRDYYRPDLEHDWDVIQAWRERGVGRLCLGWHTHPAGGRMVSANDLAHMRGLREAAGLTEMLHLVVVPSVEGWDTEGFMITARGGNSRDIVERAIVRLPIPSSATAW